MKTKIITITLAAFIAAIRTITFTNVQIQTAHEVANRAVILTDVSKVKLTGKMWLIQDDDDCLLLYGHQTRDL